MLNIAVKAARRAGQLINRASLDIDLIKISRKQHNDFVTEVDKLSEQVIVETLNKAYPSHEILTEESGQVTGELQSEYQWVIDPLDGTVNFIHGLPFYCVSIALLYQKQITQAVIYDSTRDDLFTATRGDGAFLNNRRIRVGTRQQLAGSLLATSFSTQTSQQDMEQSKHSSDPGRPLDSAHTTGPSGPSFSTLSTTRALPTQVFTQAGARLRCTGSTALDLAYVAAGRLDGFFRTGAYPWDTAAGCLLVTEAGGLIGNYAGNVHVLEHGEILAGNSKVFAQMVRDLGA